MTDVYYFLAIFAVLVAAWWVAGGPNMADLRGMFMNPLPPVGTGDAYGPTIPATPVEQYEPGEEPVQSSEAAQ